MKKTTRLNRAAVVAATACGLAGALLLPAAAMAAPSAAHAPRQQAGGGAGDDYETVDLPNGQTLKLPYKKLPLTASFDGAPATGNMTDDTVDFATAAKAFAPDKAGEDPARFVKDALVPELKKLHPEWKKVDWDAPPYIHKNYQEGSWWYNWSHLYIEDLCRELPGECGFVGHLTEKAPVVMQSDMLQGPASMTLSVSSSKTHSRTSSSGWSVGGTVKGGMSVKDGPGGDAGGSFTYSTGTSDTDSYTYGTSAAYQRNVPQGKWGWEQARMVGGKYTGFFVYPLPVEASDITDPAGYDHVRLGVFPVSVGVKAPGDLPSLSRNVVLTDDGDGKAKRAEDLEKKISDTYTQLGTANDADRRGLNTTLTTLTSQLDTALRGVKQEVQPARF